VTSSQRDSPKSRLFLVTNRPLVVLGSGGLQWQFSLGFSTVLGG
jgi:hypothetical protein